jgi:uncharacterized protein (UPF0276 family)
VSSRDVMPRGLPTLLREARLGAIVHLLELNLVRPLREQADAVQRLLALVAEIEPMSVEEDMGLWSWGCTELEQHMLQPVLDDESVRIIAANAAELQTALGVPFYAENPPIYFDLGTIDLLTFMQRVAEESACGLVLDIGHLVGYCVATGRDPIEYLGEWDGIEHVREIHVAGYELRPDTLGPMWYDNHADPISEYALDLIAIARRNAGREIAITLEQEGAQFTLIAEHITRVARRFA